MPSEKNLIDLLETDLTGLDKKDRNQLAWNVIGKLILRSKGLDENYNLGDEIHKED